MISSRRSAASKKFWDKQVTSRHRAEGDRFFRLKAQEHAALLSDKDRSSGVVDIGCGAGELLAHFALRAKVACAIDYSKSMLNRARARLEGSGIRLIHEVDVCRRMAEVDQAVWIACGSVNQYLGPRAQKRLLDVFRNNQHSRALYWFDCVDPVRYVVWGLGCNYLADRAPSLKALLWSLVLMSRQAMSSGILAKARWLGSGAMGWGYLPCFWRQECKRLNLHVEIVSSARYEYRYHVMIRKER